MCVCLWVKISHKSLIFATVLVTIVIYTLFSFECVCFLWRAIVIFDFSLQDSSHVVACTHRAVTQTSHLQELLPSQEDCQNAEIVTLKRQHHLQATDQVAIVMATHHRLTMIRCQVITLLHVTIDHQVILDPWS